MITVLDYGMGNLRNVRRALEELGHRVLVTSDPADLSSAAWIVLPGVGAFGEAVNRIDTLGFRAPLLEAASREVPILGICLGMQLLFERSEESPGDRGLGLIPGEVLRLTGKVKVPHIGWNDVVPSRESPLFPELKAGVFYFVHSFYVPDTPATIAWTSYAVEFSSAVARGPVFGVQFHPEKSQAAGLSLLRNFVGLGGEPAGNQTGE